jgi:anti-sigma factor RsiW
VSGREDTRLVDHLYGELSEKEAREYRRALDEDPALAEEASSFEETLGLLRQHEDEEPSPHLDSLILARAREEADKLAEDEKGLRGFFRKMLRRPARASRSRARSLRSSRW